MKSLDRNCEIESTSRNYPMNSKITKIEIGYDKQFGCSTFFTILFTLSFCLMPTAMANKFVDDFGFYKKGSADHILTLHSNEITGKQQKNCITHNTIWI